MPKQILLVDDSVTIHRVVEITFAQEDFAVTVVKTADEGIERAKQLRPDLVLADAGLPGKSGYDVIAALRGDGALAKTACLILTGNFTPYDDAKGGSAGADGFVVKPFETQALIDKAKDAIAKRSGGEVAAPRPAPASGVPTPIAAAPGATAVAPARPGVEPLGKPLSTVAAETSARIAAQPAGAMPAPLRPPGAATPGAPPRPQPKATLMGIPAVNPNNFPTGPAAAPPAATPPAPKPAPPVQAAPPAPKPAPPPVVAEAPRPAPPPERPAPIAKPAEVARSPIQAEPVRAAAPAQPSALPQNVPQMPRPSLVPGVATPVARAAEAPKAPPAQAPQSAAKTPPRGEPTGGINAVVREVAERAVAAVPGAIAAKGPEYEAIAKLSREVIEQVVWEVVPELAESIIRAELDRLVRERQNA